MGSDNPQTRRMWQQNKRGNSNEHSGEESFGVYLDRSDTNKC